MPIAVEKLEAAKRLIPNLRVVSDNIVRGGRPDVGGLQCLKDAGVKVIVNLCGGANLVSLFRSSSSAQACAESPEVAEEREEAKRLGLEFVSIPLDVFRTPNEQALQAFVELVRKPDKQPMFIHCLHGRDRTGLMTALYRVHCDGWTAEKAYSEMLECGFDGERTNLSDALFQFAKRRVEP
jgi:protein tyrosine/serine phosphatase